MRYLGIDYGTKRIGLALSDESAKFAFPHSAISNLTSCDVVNKIKQICMEKGVKKIILGRPELFKVTDNKTVEKIEAFKEILEKEIGLLVIFQNEALTTQEARRSLSEKNTKHQASPGPRKKTASVDASAAALILQAYLDRKE